MNEQSQVLKLKKGGQNKATIVPGALVLGICAFALSQIAENQRSLEVFQNAGKEA